MFAIPTCAVLMAIGVISFIGNEVTANSVGSSEVQNLILPQAFAEKPTQTIVDLTSEVEATDYATNSTATVEKVECKISTKGSETKVNWCKATLIQDRDVFYGIILNENGDFFTNFGDVLEVLYDAFVYGGNFEQALVEYEVEALMGNVNDILENTYPGIVIPEDYETKSFAVEWTLQSNDPDPIQQTKATVEIEY